MSAGLELVLPHGMGKDLFKANLYSELQAVIKKMTVEKWVVYFFNKKKAVILKWNQVCTQF